MRQHRPCHLLDVVGPDEASPRNGRQRLRRAKQRQRRPRAAAQTQIVRAELRASDARQGGGSAGCARRGGPGTGQGGGADTRGNRSLEAAPDGNDFDMEGVETEYSAVVKITLSYVTASGAG